MSGIDFIKEPSSKFVDYFIKPFVAKLLSYIQDSTRVLERVAEIKNTGPCFIATTDVESLYSKIGHDEGLESLRHYLRSRPNDLTPPNDFIVQLTE